MSSATVQPVLFENCSICRYIPDAFVGTDERHILLLLCDLEDPLIKFNVLFLTKIGHYKQIFQSSRIGEGIFPSFQLILFQNICQALMALSF